MHKGRLGKCVILIAKRINGYHGVVRAAVRLKDGTKFVKDRVTRIRHSGRAKFRDHNPSGSTILLQRLRVHESRLIRNPAIFNGKAMQQRRAVEQVAKCHVAHLPAAGPVAQQAAIQPAGYMATRMTLQRLKDLTLAGAQPDIRGAVGIIATVAIQTLCLRISALLIVVDLRGRREKVGRGEGLLIDTISDLFNANKLVLSRGLVSISCCSFHALHPFHPFHAFHPFHPFHPFRQLIKLSAYTFTLSLCTYLKFI